MDECLDNGNLGAGGLVARDAVVERDCMVTEEIPGRIRSEW